MNNTIPIITRYRVNRIVVDVCHGEIPDIFRTSRFGPISKFELPDTKCTDQEFAKFIESLQ